MKAQMLLMISPEEFDVKLEEAVTKAVSRIMAESGNDLVSRQQAARLIGKSTATIRRMEEKGLIRPVNQAGHPKYIKRDIIRMSGNNPAR